GFKLRCGGLEASAFPTAEQIAWALVNAQDREVPMKFTAGLHHPLRRFDDSVQAPMHGFLNVLLAGVFAGVETVDEDGLVPILLNEDPAHFAFDDNGVCWEPLSVDVAGIERSEEHTSELQSRSDLVCRLLLEKKKK